VLRTGQPGSAPEREVIQSYEINDYVSKTDLTLTKLFTVVTSALRSFRDFRAIEKSKQGLRMVLDATSSLMEEQSISQFAKGVLHQINGLMGAQTDGLLALSHVPTQKELIDQLNVIAGSGSFTSTSNTKLLELLDEKSRKMVQDSITHKKNEIDNDYTVLYIETPHSQNIIILLRGYLILGEDHSDIIKLYCDKIASSFDNIMLYNELVEERNSLEEKVKSRTLELTKANKELLFLANFDVLTGLRNRRSFYEELDRLLSKQSDADVNVAILDIDFFKKINDEFGHIAGDEALRVFSSVLETMFSEKMLTARFGGEEFVLCCFGNDLENFKILLNKFRVTISQQNICVNDQTFKQTVSVGYSSRKRNDFVIDEILHEADLALYHAKSKGRNCCVSYQELSV
jgi:diguanylate cyclase (GGDEF)-like protein